MANRLHLVLQNPPKVQPERLRQLAARLGGSTSVETPFHSMAFPVWPPRPTQDVLEAALHGRDWSLVELWLALADSAWWESARLSDRAATVSEALWRAASADARLEEELYRRSVLSLAGLPARLPAEIATAGLNGPSDRAWVLRAIHEDDAGPLIAVCTNRTPLLPVSDLLIQLGVPLLLPIRDKIPAAVVAALRTASRLSRLDGWAATVFTEARTDLQDAVFPQLLEHLTGDQLVELPQVRSAILVWKAGAPSIALSGLSPTGRRRLDDLLGVASWDQIIAATESLVGRNVGDLRDLVGRHDLDDDERIARWALQRVELWANYASRMIDTKLYVPRSKRRYFLVNDRLPTNVEVALVENPVARLTFRGLVVLQSLTGLEPTTFHRVTVSPDSPPEALRERFPAFDKVKCSGHLWQWNLYQSIEGAGIEVNEGLTRFRYPPRHIDPQTGRPKRPKDEPLRKGRRPPGGNSRRSTQPKRRVP